ncbi:hypothetical protein DFH09DRAFT_1277604 [Mycena vulgaris]|nr:hypothetical protein DFH09DRAFT_1277604 [Mycena vulgaris]
MRFRGALNARRELAGDGPGGGGDVAGARDKRADDAAAAAGTRPQREVTERGERGLRACARVSGLEAEWAASGCPRCARGPRARWGHRGAARGETGAVRRRGVRSTVGPRSPSHLCPRRRCTAKQGGERATTPSSAGLSGSALGLWASVSAHAWFTFCLGLRRKPKRVCADDLACGAHGGGGGAGAGEAGDLVWRMHMPECRWSREHGLGARRSPRRRLG